MAASIEFQKRFQELVAETDERKKTDIARKIGITYTLFSKAYNYGIVLKPLVLTRIADYFNVSLEYLLGLYDNEYFEKSQNPSSFGKRLEELLTLNNLTMNELGNKVHIHRNNISQWIKQNYVPNIDDLILLADYFKISLDYLLGRTDYI